MDEVLNFWFVEIDPSMRFKKDNNFDEMIRQRFSELYKKVRAGETREWRTTPAGRLAEIIVLDQFARNMFRDSALAFAGDNLALELAQEAVRAGDDQKLDPEQRAYLYMPFMHSESPEIQAQALQLFSQKGLEDQLRYEILHKNIIDRFGRFPHRNKVLMRTSTPDEIVFLKEKGSSF